MHARLKRAAKLALLEFPALMRLLGVKDSGKIIRVDYKYSPKERKHDSHGRRLLAAMIEDRRADYLATLRKLAAFAPYLEQIPGVRPAEEDAPFWQNGVLPVLDGIALYGLIALNNPRVYVEIGSGNSTKFARRAIRDHGLRTRIISIDPRPRAAIDSLCDEVLRSRVEDLPTEFFEGLSADDMLFFDGSHRAFQNSDVTVFFTEILPALATGMLFGVHDVFLPADYPERWLQRFYNEQYLLAAYLLGGRGGSEIVLPLAFVEQDAELSGALGRLAEDLKAPGFEYPGTAFWMRR